MRDCKLDFNRRSRNCGGPCGWRSSIGGLLVARSRPAGASYVHTTKLPSPLDFTETSHPSSNFSNFQILHVKQLDWREEGVILWECLYTVDRAYQKLRNSNLYKVKKFGLQQRRKLRSVVYMSDSDEDVCRPSTCPLPRSPLRCKSETDLNVPISKNLTTVRHEALSRIRGGLAPITTQGPPQ